jgi:hypothetical protein
VVQWSLKDRDLFCSYCFLACDTSSGVLEGFFNFFLRIAPSCHFKSMLIYRNHKQLKTNTSYNDRALSVTIHTGESGKKYLFSLFLLIKSKNYILLKIIFKFEHLTINKYLCNTTTRTCLSKCDGI